MCRGKILKEDKNVRTINPKAKVRLSEQAAKNMIICTRVNN
jgi:hypothetical protein